MTGVMKEIFRIISCVFILGLLYTCTTENEETKKDKDKKYSIYAMMKDGKEYIVQTDSLISGTTNPERQGVKVIPSRLFYDLIVRDGFYYRLDWKTSTFIKYRIQNNIFTQVSALPLTGFSTIENYNWISQDSLLLIGYDQKSTKIRYAKIQVKKMTAVEGIMQIPAPFGAFNWMSVGFSKFMNGNLFVGYTYHIANDFQTYTTSDTVYVEAMSYPEMKSIKKFKDIRSAYPGGVNTRQPHSFTDEKGDFYFITCPGIALGNNPDKPTGIYRIRQTEEILDPDYFFNISASPIQNHGYGLWYIGKGKAIVRTERKGLFTGMKDHYSVPHFDFFVLDLITKSTSRLNLPLDKGTARQCILVENGLVYITVNSDSEGSYVWNYNPETGDLRKGLKFDGDIDYILRLDRLN